MPPATGPADAGVGRARVAFVTGAARGLGASIASALLRDGCRVVFADSDPTVIATAAAAASAGAAAARAAAEIVDVRDRAAVDAALDATVARFGSLDILVNNAALTIRRTVWEIEADEWDTVMAVNLRGVLFGCQIAGAQMRRRGWGRIVNLASYAGQQPSPASGAHYAVSKAGVLMLTKVFAQELAASGVTVNAVSPSAIAGPQLDALPPAQAEALRATIPAGRFGEADDVCAAVRYLVSDSAGYVTGATLDVNGGRGMR